MRTKRIIGTTIIDSGVEIELKYTTGGKHSGSRIKHVIELTDPSNKNLKIQVKYCALSYKSLIPGEVPKVMDILGEVFDEEKISSYIEKHRKNDEKGLIDIIDPVLKTGIPKGMSYFEVCLITEERIDILLIGNDGYVHGLIVEDPTNNHFWELNPYVLGDGFKCRIKAIEKRFNFTAYRTIVKDITKNCSDFEILAAVTAREALENQVNRYNAQIKRARQRTK